MDANTACSYRFNSFLLDIKERQLSSSDAHIPLTPKVFDVLVYLVTHGGHLVHKDELMQAIWPDSFVDEVNLPRTIHTLRKVLGDDGNGNKFIETVPTKGYRFVAKVEQVDGNSSDPQVSAPELVFPAKERVEPHIVGREGGLDEKHMARSGPRPILILTITAILTVSATGFWFANGFGSLGKSFRGLTRQTSSGEAFERYRQGRLLMERGHKGDHEAALASFERAIEIDPKYPGAYAGKADAKTWLFWASRKPDDVIQARASIDKALELDGANSYAHTMLCRVKATYDWDFKGAESECRRAIELDPNDHEAHKEIAFLFNSLGRKDEAMREIDVAVSLAPTSFNKRSRGLILYHSRHYDEAIEQLRQVEATDPNEYDTRRWLMDAYEMKKDFSHAHETLIRQMEFDGETPEAIAQAKAVFDTHGWPGVLRDMIDPQRTDIDMAATYAQLGDKEKAFELLENAFDRHVIMLITSAREPRLDPLRSDPRFDALLKRIGLQ